MKIISSFRVPRSVFGSGRPWLGVLALVLVARAFGGTPPLAFQAGAAAVDITPEAGATNWVTNRPYEGILDRLHVRALSLAAGDDRVCLLTLDITDISEPDVVAIRQAVGAAIGLAPGRILINSSHNHSGPTSPRYKEVGDPTRKVAANELLEKWKRELPAGCVQAARQADLARRPVSLGIGRANVGQWLFNRRPVRPDGMVKSTLLPADANSLPGGLRFGPVDPIVEVLSFRDAAGKSVATVFTLGCHAVAVYSESKAVSADWPGIACQKLQESLGGEVLFLQGCGGDIVPARRGLQPAKDMGVGIAERVTRAAAQTLPLNAAPISVAQAVVGLPLTPASITQLGRPTNDSEVQVITCGELAIVALPGEPLVGLSQEIKRASPFPHTLVLGYSNGDGVEYVGLPGEKARGGYEMGPYGLGTDECGGILVAAAARLLQEQWTAAKRAMP